MKHLEHDFGYTRRLILSVIWYIEKKVYRRDWTYCDQVWNARVNVSEDRSWFSTSKTSNLICERHLSNLKDTWYTTSHMNQSAFRDKHSDLLKEKRESK